MIKMHEISFVYFRIQLMKASFSEYFRIYLLYINFYFNILIYFLDLVYFFISRFYFNLIIYFLDLVYFIFNRFTIQLFLEDKHKGTDNDRRKSAFMIFIYLQLKVIFQVVKFDQIKQSTFGHFNGFESDHRNYIGIIRTLEIEASVLFLLILIVLTNSTVFGFGYGRRGSRWGISRGQGG